MKTEKLLVKGTDEEVLTEFVRFLKRVSVTTKFIQNDDGLITHHLMVAECGEKFLASDPIRLDWSMQPMPVPEAFEGRLN